MKYQYRITHVNRAEHLIYISSDSGWDCEEPDSFVYLLQKIVGDVGGEIKDIGDLQYAIQNDGLGLIYQWDGCFGISVRYPAGVAEEMAIDFMKRYL